MVEDHHHLPCKTVGSGVVCHTTIKATGGENHAHVGNILLMANAVQH